MCSVRLICVLVLRVSQIAWPVRVRQTLPLTDAHVTSQKVGLTAQPSDEVDELAHESTMNVSLLESGQVLRHPSKTESAEKPKGSPVKADPAGKSTKDDSQLYNKIKHMKRSEIWRIVEERERALRELEASIKSGWAKIQRKRGAVSSESAEAYAQIEERRKVYNANMEAVEAARAEEIHKLNDHSDVDRTDLSTIVRDMEEKQLALTKLQESMDARWDKAQREWDAIEAEWEKKRASFDARRKAYRADAEAIKAKRIQAKKQRLQIRNLKKFAKSKRSHT